MAKDVNLTSKEWIDLVFEGKNKEFGAYQMRRQAGLFHIKALLYTLIGVMSIGVVAAAILGGIKLVEAIRESNVAVEQELTNTEYEEEEMEDEKLMEHKEEEKEVLKEEVQSSQQFTELKITNEKVEVKTNLDVEKNDEVVSNVNVQGTDNITVDAAKEEVKVVEEKKEEKPEPKPEPKKEEIFKSAEQMPSFPGGDAALMKFLNSHIHYPAAAEENNVQGRVIVQFVVGKDGSVSQAKIARGVHPALDNEALRVVRSLPKFIPGKQNGQPVSVWYTLPVQFKLQNAN